MDDLIWIGWTGPNVSPEERVIVNHAAAKYIREGVRAPKVYFSHSKCEGVMTREKEGVFGTYAGTFFTFDLGEFEKGKRRVLSCLMPRRTASQYFESDEPVRLARTKVRGSGRGTTTVHEVDPPRESAIRIDTLN